MASHYSNIEGKGDSLYLHKSGVPISLFEVIWPDSILFGQTLVNGLPHLLSRKSATFPAIKNAGNHLTPKKSF